MSKPDRVIRLMNLEKFYETLHPVTTITFYSKDKADLTADKLEVQKHLQIRLNAIVEANPWLTGHIVSSYFYGSTLQYNSVPSMVPVEVTQMNELSQTLDYMVMAKLLAPYEVLNGSKLLNTAEPLIRVHWFDISDTIGAMLFSVSHIVADGHTYYELYGMMNATNPIVALDPERLHKFEALSDKVVKGEKNDAISLIHSIPYILNVVNMNLFQPTPVLQMRSVDHKWLTDEKARYANTAVPFVSTNDILTSWFFRKCNTDVGLMAINFRNRIDLIHDKHAGNYESLLGYQPEDYATPDLIRESLAKDQLHRVRSGNFPWMFSGTTTLISSWATIYKAVDIPHWTMLEHIPVQDVNGIPPFTNCAVIFQRTKTSIGILFGTRTMEDIENDPAIFHQAPSA